MKFEQNTKRMYLSELYPDVTPEQVAENTGFEVDISEATTAQEPTEQELSILREQVDPQRLILG
jgi:glutaconate CoA-transferase, subunit B